MKLSYIAIGILSILSFIYLFHGFSNLLAGDNLPVDLALRYWQSKELIWNKINIYAQSEHAQYPPSFYLFLYPLMHLFSYKHTDLSWLFANVLLLTIAATILFQLGNHVKKSFGWILMLCFFCFHAIPHGLGVGQVHLIPPIGILVYIYLTTLKETTRFTKLVALIFLTISLGKLSLSIPFALLLLTEKEHRKALLSAVGINILLSGLVLYRVESTILGYMTYLLTNSNAVATLGHLDVQRLTSILSLPSYFSMIIGLFLLVLLIVFAQQIHLSVWDKLALTALTARFFIYHAHYDNTILLFVLIAVFMRLRHSNDRWQSIVILVFFVLSMVIPARYLEWQAPTFGLGLVFQLCIWLYSGYYLITNKFIQSDT